MFVLVFIFLFLVIVSLPCLTQAHPSHAQFLNKKIKMFVEMALVVGKDMTTKVFPRELGW